jgi:hypothetical protein
MTKNAEKWKSKFEGFSPESVQPSQTFDCSKQNPFPRLISSARLIPFLSNPYSNGWITFLAWPASKAEISPFLLLPTTSIPKFCKAFYVFSPFPTCSLTLHNCCPFTCQSLKQPFASHRIFPFPLLASYIFRIFAPIEWCLTCGWCRFPGWSKA